MSKPISPLRQRMIDDMTFRNMSPSTHKVYTYAVANFSTFHGRSPDKLGIEDVREYRLHLIARGLKANSINPIIGALRFFYGTTLGRKDIADQLPFARKEDTLPAVLSQDEVLRLLRAALQGRVKKSHRHLAMPHRRACGEALRRIDDGVGVDAVMPVEVVDGAGLAEMLDAQGLDAMAAHAAKPAQCRGMAVDRSDDAAVPRQDRRAQ